MLAISQEISLIVIQALPIASYKTTWNRQSCGTATQPFTD